MNISNRTDLGAVGIRSLIITLAAAVCLAGMYFGIVRLKEVIATSPQQVKLYYKKTYRFSEEEKVAFLKNHAGLWIFDIQTMADGKMVGKKDRLEIKENGIIWQVVEWSIPLPSGAVSSFCQIKTAFLKPYGIVKGDSVCDAYVLTQAFVENGDTCFGAWTYPELWSLKIDGGAMVFNRRRYTPFRGELADFFPAGAIASVQSAEGQFFKDTVMGTTINQLYSVRRTDPKSGTVRLIPIRDSITDLSDLLKKSIQRKLSSLEVDKVNREFVISGISSYYDPFIITEKMRSFPRELPEKISASFTVKTNGVPDTIKLTSAVTIDKMLSEAVSKEIGSWHFPTPIAPVRITYDFKMP
jgi:hypothetical protein